MIKYLYKDFNLKIYDKDILKAELNYVINDEIIIKNIVEYDDNNLIEFKSKYLSKLIDKLISLTYYLEKSYVYKGDIDLTIQHFIKDDNLYFLDYNTHLYNYLYIRFYNFLFICCLCLESFLWFIIINDLK